MYAPLSYLALPLFDLDAKRVVRNSLQRVGSSLLTVIVLLRVTSVMNGDFLIHLTGRHSTYQGCRPVYFTEWGLEITDHVFTDCRARLGCYSIKSENA